ncbi:MALR1 protein, partial [Tricholaema leucomelas]|nr:MALR1 protein [Tricholaema leucomelas]
RCGKEWKGNRCHISAKPPQPPALSLLPNGEFVTCLKYLLLPCLNLSFPYFYLCFAFADIWIGLGIGFLLIKIAAATLCFLSKKKVPEMNLEKTAYTSFANPLYEDLGSSEKAKSPGSVSSPTVQISVSPWREYLFNEDVNATSFPNPLYGEASEDIEKLCSALK